MATTIKTKHSNTATNAPTNLESGELAVNTVDKKMWIGNGSTEVVLIGNKLSGIEAAEASSGGFLVGDGTKFVVETEGTARTSLGLGSLATESVVNLSSQVTNTLSVGNGGTGATSFTAGAILKGAGTSALVASGVTIDSNNVLTFGGNGFVIPKATSNPLSPTAGQLFSDSSSSRLKYQAGATARELAYTSEIPAAANDGTLTLATSGTGLSGSAAFTANDSDNVTFTVTSNATNANTASTIVARDASGNFSAGTITAALSGNATTATTLANSRNFSITGAVTASAVSFNGGANVTLNTSMANNAVTLGTHTAGNYVATIAGTTNEITVSGSGSETAAVTIGLPDDVTITNDLTVSNDLTVTGNLTVNGTTTTVNTTNLNVTDTLVVLNQGLTAGNASDIGFIFERGTTGDNAAIIWDESTDTFTLGTTTATGSIGGDITVSKGTLVADLTGDVTGNASTATTLANSRNFSITGAVTASAVSFNGSGNVALNTSMANNAVTLGTHTTGNYVASVSAGTGISVSGTGEGATVTITNSAPDQTVALTGSGSVSISGTYPNFTITGTDTNTTYTAGTGLTLSGTQFSIATNYAGQTSITTLGTVTTGTIDGGTF